MPDWGRRLRQGARGRLPRPLYELATRLVPIACVDVLPHRTFATGIEIGLIERLDAGGARVWCLVGGGIHRGEPLQEAVARHIRTTLGPAVAWTQRDFACPATVGEYFPDRRPGEAHDPRKHAVALTYPVELGGEVTPRGEALGFKWFPLAEIPYGEMGFGQEAIVRRVLADRLPAAASPAVPGTSASERASRPDAA